MSIQLYKQLRTFLRRCIENGIEEMNIIISMYEDSDVEEAVHLRDYFGNLLIHYACYYSASVEVVQFLLDREGENKFIYEQNLMGWLPIHAAIEEPSNLENVRMLIDRDIENITLVAKDVDGRVPLYTACDKNGSVEVIQFLLQACICDRIEKLGSAEWELCVQELINNMTTEDSRRKVQEIYESLSKYEIKRSMSLLALAVWRTSCLHWGDFKFKSMQQMEDFRETDGAFDPAEYKRERRIKS